MKFHPQKDYLALDFDGVDDVVEVGLGEDAAKLFAGDGFAHGAPRESREGRGSRRGLPPPRSCWRKPITPIVS